MTAEFACGYVIRFADDGPSEEQVLHIGTRTECDELYARMPGVAYAGSRPVLGAEFVVVPLDGEGE